MKTIRLENKNGIIFNLNIPDHYEKISLPYFKEWVEALDSGEYAQGSGVLCMIGNSIKSYCCLGVLSKVQGRLTEDMDGENGNNVYLSEDNPNYPFLRYYGVFPNGIEVIFHDRMIIKNLVELNDNNLPFSEISKVIKEIWKEESLDNVQ